MHEPQQTPIKERVRAVLITPEGRLLLMRRVRPGADPYWVVVGGGVEPEDASVEDALRREIREEVAGEAEILDRIYTLESPGERQHFYWARISHWDPTQRTGPEFTQPDRGEYTLVEIDANPEALDAVNLLPPHFAAVLRQALHRGEVPDPVGDPDSAPTATESASTR